MSDISSFDLARAFSSARILVIGDVMLDRYWFGDVNRISPEAPVPVVRVQREETRPGGAANVARNIASLSGKTLLLSVIGEDEAGNLLTELLRDERIETCFTCDADFVTTVKLRVIGRQQQLLRIDFEAPPSGASLVDKLSDYERHLPSCDVVIISDYDKGALVHVHTMIEKARQHHRPVLVDPKGANWEKYRGASMITPNRGELSAVIGTWNSELELQSKVLALLSALEIETLLLTRSEEGMTLFQHGCAINVPTRAREVFDVSGAGDTVIAVVGLALAAKMPLIDAVQLANKAAGIVVGKFGTATCTLGELAAED
ncbi:MAG: D-glycero-beta-D-manno-heptose-7-phosphate kinase [Burkholderiales bacterium]|jgi:rfaE bifunctional protein kinase chain/domain|nr:D-glycero-beta-D-manno-heptose-7-phosphate kinase [Burkholderiales bacterium]